MGEPSPLPPSAAFGDLQIEIYLAGLSGTIPALPMDFAHLEARGRPRRCRSPVLLLCGRRRYGDEQTQRANVAAFRGWGLVPRMFVGAVTRDLGVDLFGLSLRSPLVMAPIGVIGLCAQDGQGELATATAAAQLTGVPMIASTLSMCPMEDVAASMGDTPGFFQLYTPTDRELAESFVRRAEASGFKAIVVTLDTWLPGWRPRDLATSNFPMLRGHCLANYTSDPVFCARLRRPPEDDMAAAVALWVGIFGHPLTWDDLAWLRSMTDLPLIVKGICHPDDARRARDGGVDAIYCSNHGGRRGQWRASCPPLPPRTWWRRLMDRRFCSDSRCAFGRRRAQGRRPRCDRRRSGTAAYAYGLALGGADGVVHVLRSILAEADLIMAVDGYPSLADLKAAGLRRVTAG